MHLGKSKIFANNWVITLTATLIGVFSALYLNEKVASMNLSNQKEVATKNILAEISSNKTRLERSINKHVDLLDFMVFQQKYSDDEDNLIAPSDSMNMFKNQHPNLIVIKDSTLLSNGNYKYKGETNFDISTLHLNLITIAWKTLKNSRVSASYGFECLMYLESIDMIINEIIQKDEELLEYLSGMKDSGKKNDTLITHLNFLISYERGLIEIYERSEEELKKCG